MLPIITLTKKELRDLFASPIAYVFITLFLFVAFWLYFYSPSNIFTLNQIDVRDFFSWFPFLFVFFLPALTMRLWADEKRNGTFELLMTMPASDVQIIIGKLLSTVVFLLVVLLLTLPLCITLAWLGNVDWGQIVACYLGVLVLGTAYLALGLFISSLTRDQIIAYLVTVVVLFLFYALAGPFVIAYLPESLVPVVQYLSFNTHFESMARGVMDIRDVIYFISATGLFIYANYLSLAARKV